MTEAFIGTGNRDQKLALKLFEPFFTNHVSLCFGSKLQKAKKIANNIHENSLMQNDCSAVYHTTILTVFETEFKNWINTMIFDIVRCRVNFAINHNQILA